KSLQKWVKESGGGLVFVAGAMHTAQLAKPGLDADLSAIKALCPVALKDGRLHFEKAKHDASRPYALDFTKAAVRLGVLTLNPEGDGTLAGWGSFFWKDGKRPDG